MSRLRRLPSRIAGNLALDLANTVSWRGTEREIDHLAESEGLLRWARAADIVDQDWLPDDVAASLAAIHRLRAAVGAAGGAVAGGMAPPAEALAAIAHAAAATLSRGRLSGAPAQLDFIGDDRILGPLAWSALDLLRGGELGRLRQCPPDDCRWLFIDRTKNGSRRWCDMATCGNRAKARRMR